MKTRYIGLGCLALTLMLGSCNDALDISPTDNVNDKIVWSDATNAELVVNNFYSDIAWLGSFNTYECYVGMTEGLTDELKYGNMLYNAFCFIPNEISYGGVVLQPGYVDVYLGVWGTTMTEIRHINETIGHLQTASFDEATKIRLLAESRFFRGMLYFELLKRYHQVVLYDEDLTKVSTDQPLADEATAWDFVYQDLKFAGENLPQQTSAAGRITSGAAWGLMSRAMLYCQNWKAAQEGAEQCIKQGYSLAANYADAYSTVSGNPEAILSYSYSDADGIYHSFDGYYSPGGDFKAGYLDMEGGYATPTQEMVEEYETADGKKVDWTKWHSTTGVNDEPPYADLEPRFAATILYNGSQWKGRTIEPFVGGNDGWATWETDAKVSGRTTTGYYLRKLVDETHTKASQHSVQPWVGLRLAEVYLNLAESCYRLGDNATAMEYINKVRARVGLPTVAGLTGDDLFAALRHERKVELAYEGLYYWDMRRWGLATKAFTGIRRHGLKIEQNANGSFTYTYVPVDNQNLNYPEKMNRLPLPQAEIEDNKDVEQFPEWK